MRYWFLGCQQYPADPDTIVVNLTYNLTKDHPRHRVHHEVTLAVDDHHLPCAPIVANADTSPKTAEVRLARKHQKLSTSHQQQRQQTEPPTEAELADGSPVQNAAVKTPRGDGGATPMV